MMKKILLLLFCLCVMRTVCYAYDDVLNVEVGETFTVYGESHTHIQAVLWHFDPALFETVSVSEYSTRGKFKAIQPTPSVGSVIQATIYYYRDGTTASGINKAVSSWLVHVADDGSTSTVSLPPSLEMEVGETTTIKATTSSSEYSGDFSWHSDNPSKVDIISESGNTATLRAYAKGSTRIYVTLDNGNNASTYVSVNEESAPTVTASPGSGSYEQGTKIYLRASTSDATIRYTTDGSTPTSSSQKYSSYLTLNEPFTLKARAYNSSGAAGDVLTCNYTIKYPEINGICYRIISTTDKTVEVVKNPNRYKGNIVIPKKVNIEGVTYTVVRIGDWAFNDCFILHSISIPNSVTSIGDWAFSACGSLHSISIPNSVTSIGDMAFFQNSLTDIIVDKDNPAYSSIDGVLYNKSQTILICCPERRTGDAIIPNSVKTIGKAAFYGCSRLSSISIPNSVTSIGKDAFSCSSLPSISIPNSVTSIGDRAFTSCSSLTDIAVDKDNPAYSSIDGVLYNKSQTILICCPGGRTGDAIIPNSVKTIGKIAFHGCSRLTSITIPKSVTSIGDHAFYYCSSLTSIASLAVTPPKCDIDCFEHIIDNCTLYVPTGSKQAYKQASEWKDFPIIKEIVLVSEIQLNETKLSIEEENTFQLIAEVLPANAAIKDLLWESSNESCVTVDAKGLLTAVAQGSATITVNSADGYAQATCLVKVTSPDSVSSVEADATSVEVYTLEGVKVANSTENLPAGIYVVRKGSSVSKIVVR